VLRPDINGAISAAESALASCIWNPGKHRAAGSVEGTFRAHGHTEPAGADDADALQLQFQPSPGEERNDCWPGSASIMGRDPDKNRIRIGAWRT